MRTILDCKLSRSCIKTAQAGANALSAAFYPTECRATGVSLSNGVGRCGSMLGAPPPFMKSWAARKTSST